MSVTERVDSTAHWSGRVRDALTLYAEPLLRSVVNRLLKPRNQWPIDELIERSVAAMSNVAVLDRRLKDLPLASRRLLAIIGVSKQPVWRVGHLLAILATIGHAEGLAPIQALLECGMIYPELPVGMTSLKQFEEWLAPSGINSARLFAPPAVTSRMEREDLGVPIPVSKKIDVKTIPFNDGLEWLLRTAIVWQIVSEGGLRLTQQQSLFKRDLLRFQTDVLLAAPFAEHLTDLPDVGLFTLGLAVAAGVIESSSLEIRSIPAPLLWEEGLLAAFTTLWRSLFAIETWDPIKGYELSEDGNSFASVVVVVFLVLRSCPGAEWCQAKSIAEYIFQHHPSWAARLNNDTKNATLWVEKLLLGVCRPLRLVEYYQESGSGWFRLGDVGRHLVRGETAPQVDHDFRQTLVAQPNGEMVIFRQGLTPRLIGALTRFAVWKTLGAACTMELTAESVYRGLETGLTLFDIQRLLEQHGTRALPATVLDSLQRWANKRDRITVYTSATLMEFTNLADLEAAFSRGLISVKLTDRIGLSAAEGEIEYRHFRLIGNRDYESRPQKCITFDADGVSFTVDTAQSDLILEAELDRLVESLPATATGQRRFILTPASLKRAQNQGVTIGELDQWALDRSGESLSSAARLLFVGSGGVAGRYQRRLVLHFSTETVTDGVLQWPATARLIEERLGACSVAVSESSLPALKEHLQSIGIELQPVDERE